MPSLHRRLDRWRRRHPVHLVPAAVPPGAIHNGVRMSCGLPVGYNPCVRQADLVTCKGCLRAARAAKRR